jgi:hypothetical protein
MGFLDSIFGREKQDAPVSLMTPQQQSSQSTLLGRSTPLAESALGQYSQPYPGQLTTEHEQKGLQTLGDYLGSTMPGDTPMMQGAQGELEKTFSGEYDPVAGTYYQAYRTAVLRELEQAKDRLAAETSAGDKYFGGGRIKETGELEEGATNNLAVVLGQLFENERQNRLNAVPMAASLTGANEAMTQGRVGASQQYGGLEFQREYGDFLRQMQEMGIPLETAMSLSTHNNEYYQPGYEPSWFERVMLPMVQTGAKMAGSISGGA